MESIRRMGIIKKIPMGEVSEWCAPMMTVPKKTGAVRLVTNFRGLNKYCSRATHPTQDKY